MEARRLNYLIFMFMALFVVASLVLSCDLDSEEQESNEVNTVDLVEIF